MSAYVLSVDSDLDLDDIWEYIAEDSVDAADRWVGKLFDAFESLGRTPGMGHRREDLTAFPVLFWPVGAYLVIYSAKPPHRDRGSDAGFTRYSGIPAPSNWLIEFRSKTCRRAVRCHPATVFEGLGKQVTVAAPKARPMRCPL